MYLSRLLLLQQEVEVGHRACHHSRLWWLCSVTVLQISTCLLADPCSSTRRETARRKASRSKISNRRSDTTSALLIRMQKTSVAENYISQKPFLPSIIAYFFLNKTHLLFELSLTAEHHRLKTWAYLHTRSHSPCAASPLLRLRC